MSRKTSAVDDAHLAKLGHEPELSRHFSFVSMLGMAFAILNSWTALAASMSLALPSGGPTSVLWGLITAAICNLAIATSLAEFLSAYPTASGQYHWVAVCAWDSWVPILSWITGWVNVSGWIALTATGGLLGSQLIVGIISLYDVNYTQQRWQQFLIYIGYTLFAFLVNAFANSILPHLNRAAFLWSLTGFAIICITVLSTASPDYASAKFVFTDFLNQTGWPDGVAWLLGLLQGGLGVTGFDAVAHMIEELPDATVNGPKIMIACVGIGAGTGFIFLMILLFVSGGPSNLDNIINSSAGPLGLMTTSSRMSWSFARDGGLPCSKHFSRIHPTLGVPLNSLFLTTALVIIFGCIFLGSDTAFNAITAASVVALGISYGMPIAVNVLQGRSKLPPRPFTLPEPVGWALNLLGLAYITVTTVLFVFPPDLPVNADNMNYCIVAFGIIILISGVTWFANGRKNFTGPRLGDGDFLEAEASRPGAFADASRPMKEKEIATDDPEKVGDNEKWVGV